MQTVKIPKFILILALMIPVAMVKAVTSSEKIVLDKARVAYENGNLEQAILLYNQISIKSDFWVESLEEKAWAYLRKKNTNEATSLAKTLLSEMLAPLVGPEPYYLQVLIEYRLCDYRAIFKTIKLFKNRYAERTSAIQTLAETGTNKASEKAIQTLFVNAAVLSQLKGESFGAEIQFLPRYFYRDRNLISAVKAKNKVLVAQRLQNLAKQDLTEISDILRKLQLVETQVVQQVYAYEDALAEKRKANFKNNKGYNSDEIYFPEDGEIWLDEMDQFQSSTASCPVDPFDNPMPGRKPTPSQAKTGGK